jgi:hypothetical protein
MTIRRWAVAAAVLVVVAVAAVLVVSLARAPRPVAADGYRGHPASPTPAPTATSPRAAVPTPKSPTAASASPADGSPGLGTGTADSAATATLGTTGTSGAPVGTTTGHPTWDPADGAPDGADAQPKVPSGLGTEAYRLPAAPAREPALATLPSAAASPTGLVTGFPTDVVPVPDGAEVQSSSVVPQGRRVLVGLHALSDDAPEDLLAVYARTCGDRGWAVTRTPAPDGAAQLRCGFGPDSVTATARPLPTGRVDLVAGGAFDVPEDD